MPEKVFVSGPLADHVSLIPAEAQGYGLTGTGVVPLATLHVGVTLAGGMTEAPWVSVLFAAIGGQPERLPGGGVIYLASGQGDWDCEAWDRRWRALLPFALDELRTQSDPAVLRTRLPMILSRAAAQVAGQSPKPAAIRSNALHDSVQVLDEISPHDAFFRTKSYRLKHPRFDGTFSEEVPREVFVATDAAIVLPYDPVRDRVLLVEQFRMGPFGRGDARPWMLEPVAGRVDGGEGPEATARRECKEEAGLVLHGLEHVSSHYCSPGCSTEYFHCYLGLCDLPDLSQGQGGLATEHEDIRTHVLSFEAAQTLLTSGEADNGPLVLLLIWLAANRSRLRGGA